MPTTSGQKTKKASRHTPVFCHPEQPSKKHPSAESLQRKDAVDSEHRLSKKRLKQPKKKFNAKSIKIEAQVYAKELYEKVGFVQKFESFLEDGIPHVLMQYTE